MVGPRYIVAPNLLLPCLLHHRDPLHRGLQAGMVVEEVGHKCKIELLVTIDHVLKMRMFWN